MQLQRRCSLKDVLDESSRVRASFFRAYLPSNEQRRRGDVGRRAQPPLARAVASLRVLTRAGTPGRVQRARGDREGSRSQAGRDGGRICRAGWVPRAAEFGGLDVYHRVPRTRARPRTRRVRYALSRRARWSAASGPFPAEYEARPHPAQTAGVGRSVAASNSERRRSGSSPHGV